MACEQLFCNRRKCYDSTYNTTTFVQNKNMKEIQGEHFDGQKFYKLPGIVAYIKERRI